MKFSIKKVFIASVFVIICIILSYYFFIFVPHQKAVNTFNDLVEKIENKNIKLEKEINISDNLLKSDDKPLEDDLSSELKSEIKAAKKEIREIPKIKSSTKDINKQISSLQKPLDYTTEIENIKDLNQRYSTSVKQLKQITNPTSSFIEERLKEIDTVTGVQPVTEDNDPNQGLNKQGSYTASVYFTNSLVTDYIEGTDIVDKGTDAGGNIEVYKTAKDAQKRNEFLSTFDGLPALLNPGSHYTYGTIVIRISGRLTASQQNDLTQKIYKKLIEISDDNKTEKSSTTETSETTSSTSIQTSESTQLQQWSEESNTTTLPTVEQSVDISTETSHEYDSNIDENGYNKLTGQYVSDMIKGSSSEEVTTEQVETSSQ